MRRGTVLLAIAWLFSIRIGWTQPPVPDEALAAEGAGRWNEALDVYRRVLAEDPRRADLWIRVADIEALRGNLAVTIRALERAIALTPDAAGLYQRLSQAEAATGNPAAALDAIDRAVELKPDSVDYLEARATLATWAGDYHRARDSYRRLREDQPESSDLTVKLARVSAWAGKTDEAAEEYRRYLDARPDDADVWLELEQVEAWRGNYRAALDVLDEYRSQFGETTDYRHARADVLARADRPGEAIALLRPLLADAPDSYTLNLSRTIAEAMDGHVRGARAGLDSIRQLDPERPETRTAEQLVRTLLGSAIDPRASVYSDSDGLRVARLAPQGTLVLATGTRVSGGFERQVLKARAGSGLEQTDGTLSAAANQLWMGLAQRLGWTAVRGQVGQADSGVRKLTTYAAGLEIEPADAISLAYDWSSDLLVISPRTVGLGLTRTGQAARLVWNPTVQDYLGLDVAYETFSDGNRRWFVAFSPRRSIVRNQQMNLDLGLSIRQLRTAEDLDHGYYDPARFESYEMTLFPYFKISGNTGLGLSVALGAQRDTMSSFRFGGDASVEATIGIYRRWAVKLSGSGTLNRRLESGAYQAYGGGIVLIRRF
jgi:tetratricopeptide (TPR) repeat protein